MSSWSVVHSLASPNWAFRVRQFISRPSVAVGDTEGSVPERVTGSRPAGSRFVTLVPGHCSDSDGAETRILYPVRVLSTYVPFWELRKRRKSSRDGSFPHGCN